MEKELDKNVHVTVVNEASLTNNRVEIYKATLTFLSGLAIPAAILILGVIYQDSILQAIKDGKLKKIDTPFITAEFVEGIVDDISNPNAKVETVAKAETKIEVAEEIARLQIESGNAKEPPIEAISSPAVQLKYQNEWTNILGISWVKPNDFFGRTYFLKAKTGIYIWPTRIDKENNRVRFIVNNSSNSRTDGMTYLDNIWVKIGKPHEFKVGKKEYRLTLVNIKKAGKLPSYAAYISIDEK